jgi:hypothetical protein
MQLPIAATAKMNAWACHGAFFHYHCGEEQDWQEIAKEKI